MDKNIIVDYYQGAYGPTLRIDIVSLDDLSKIKNLFVDLSKSIDHQVDLTKFENAIATGLNSLILQSSSKIEKNQKKLTQIHQGNNINFLWKTSPQDWARIVSLVQQLIDVKRPGHQYLTEEGVDDALVEFVFMERANQ